jgi:hypothetical protein
MKGDAKPWPTERECLIAFADDLLKDCKKAYARERACRKVKASLDASVWLGQAQLLDRVQSRIRQIFSDADSRKDNA